jgi:hypothetical protein
MSEKPALEGARVGGWITLEGVACNLVACIRLVMDQGTRVHLFTGTFPE